MKMKYLAMTIFGVSLFFSPSWADEKPSLTDEKDKISYSVGYQMGGDFKRQKLEINPELLLRGIQDALAETEPAMSKEEMRTTLVDLKKKVTADQRKQMQADAAKNLADGKAFLAENAKKEGVKTLPSGLQYKIIQEGSGQSPNPGDSVTVHYRGTLIDGSEFDSSYGRGEPATFKSDRVISGWKEALPMMKQGAKWQLFIPPELAYGERGAGSKIPPSSTLVFEVELISVNP